MSTEIKAFCKKWGINLTESRAEEFALDMLKVGFKNGGSAEERSVFIAAVREALREAEG